MRLFFCCSIISLLAIASCESSQKIMASWVNRGHVPTVTPSSIFVLALASNDENRFIIENMVGDLLVKRGKTVVKSSELMPVRIPGVKATQEQFDNIVKGQGCTAVITLSLLDTKTEQHYVSGTSYVPYNYSSNNTGGYYGNVGTNYNMNNGNNGMNGNNYGGYYGYYSYYSPQVYSSGYYETNKTYYVETNFYDIVNDNLVWSIQSSATNPEGFRQWFPKYSQLILSQLQKEGLIAGK